MALPLFNIGGLASGLDTSSMIDSLIEVERIPVQQLVARKAEYQAKDNAWQDVNTRFSAIRTALNALDTRDEIDAFATATSSDDSIATASATGAVNPGAVTFTVDQLAAVHQLASTTNFTGGDDLVGAGNFTITVDGTDHTIVTTASTTLNELSQQINALEIGVSSNVLWIDGTNTKLTLTADSAGLSNAFTTSGTVAGLGSFSIVEQGADAELTLGSGPGALTITRSSNVITDLVDGVSINLNRASATAVTVTLDRDIDAAVGKVTELIDQMNSALTALGDYTRYDSVSETAGILVGDSAARDLAFDLRSSLSSIVNQQSSEYAVPSSIGISLNRSGTYDFDESKLRAAMEADFDAVANMFTISGSSADSRVSYVSKTAATADGAYQVVVTQAGSQAEVTGSSYSGWFFNRSFDVTYGGTTTTVNIPAFSSVSAAVDQINADLDTAGISQVRASVEDIGGGNQAIKLGTSAYGSSESFIVGGGAPFGLTGTYSGTDVAGTIGGEAATGSGRTLIADAGSPQGLQVLISATPSEVSGAGGSLSLGDVVLSSGMMGALDGFLDLAEGSGGKIDRARDTWQSQITLADERIEILEDRIDRREALLVKQFAALETAMSTLSSQAAWLTSQLGAQSSAS